MNVFDIVEAFYNANPDAEKDREGWHCSLYQNVSYYGGPEEGGWWDSDTVLEATQWYPTRQLAERALRVVEDVAKGLSKDAQRQHDGQCATECEWLDDRGLDADYLPEVAGADDYYATLERYAGSRTNQGLRHYE